MYVLAKRGPPRQSIFQVGLRKISNAIMKHLDFFILCCFDGFASDVLPELMDGEPC